MSYQCPKSDFKAGPIRFQDKSGFKNPYRHLMRCFAKGKPANEQETKLLDLYKEALEKSKSQGGTIRSHFASTSLNEYEKTVAAYIRLLVTKNLPLTLVSDPKFRSLPVMMSVFLTKQLYKLSYD